MVTIEPAHIRPTDQAEHVLAVRKNRIPQNDKASDKNLVFRQSKNLK